MSITPQRRRLLVRIVVLAVLAGGVFTAWRLLRPAPAAPDQFTGYVTSSNLYMAAPVAGALQKVEVRRGDRVVTGSALFQLDPTTASARTDQAGAQLAASDADIAVQRAGIARAEAALRQAEVEADRTAVDLRRYLSAQAGNSGAVAQQQVDQARAAAENAARARDAARAQLNQAQAQVQAAASQAQGARAGVTAARRQLAEQTAVSPATGYVEDVLYQAGEWVPANAAVVSIVPDDQLRVRFYVPQGRIGAYRPGSVVPVSCDGCASGLSARIDYVAPRPEFTPPVIYSLATRDKLVFMVEAVPSSPRALMVGQPISVAAIDHPATER